MSKFLKQKEIKQLKIERGYLAMIFIQIARLKELKMAK